LNDPVTTQVEELGGDTVRLKVDVPAHDVHHAVEHATSDLAQSVKIPGFRPGKVPIPVLKQRLGPERIMAEAVDSHISGWFWNAASRARIRPVAQPQYDYELPTADDADWSFTATVPVQPKVEVVDWTELEVGKPDADVPEELVTAELDRIRESVAELVPADGRPAREGDTLVVDIVMPEGEAQRDTVVELGSGRLVDEVEAALAGVSAGETKSVTYELADETTATVEITVKEISEKVLPELDDELARSASEFDTIAELRADVESRIREAIESEIENVFRANAVDALVAASKVAPAGPLVESRTRELLNGFVRSLERRGIDPQTYLNLSGRSEQELVASLRMEAALSVARELALEAVADKVGIEVSDDEVKDLIREQAEAAGEDADNVIEELWQHGRQEDLREDLRLRAALDRVAAEVKPIPLEQAQARESIWTPDKEKPETETTLWTPGSPMPGRKETE
jgi:trigger factor